MPLFTLILILIAVGICLYVVNRYVPMDANIKQIINVVVLLAVVIWLLDVFGVINLLNGVKVGR